MILKAVNDNYTATSTHLQHKAASTDKEANTAKGLLHTLDSVRFISFLDFMCTLQLLLVTCLKHFNVSFSEALDELDATLTYLEQLSTSPGHVYFKFLQEFDNPTCPIKFRGFDIVGGKKGENLSKCDSDTIIG